MLTIARLAAAVALGDRIARSCEIGLLTRKVLRPACESTVAGPPWRPTLRAGDNPEAGAATDVLGLWVPVAQGDRYAGAAVGDLLPGFEARERLKLEGVGPDLVSGAGGARPALTRVARGA